MLLFWESMKHINRKCGQSVLWSVKKLETTVDYFIEYWAVLNPVYQSCFILYAQQTLRSYWIASCVWDKSRTTQYVSIISLNLNNRLHFLIVTQCSQWGKNRTVICYLHEFRESEWWINEHIIEQQYLLLRPSSELKSVAISSSEISVNFYRTELRRFPRDGNPRSYRCDNLNSCTWYHQFIKCPKLTD